MGNPTRVRRAELSTASPDLVNTPGSRGRTDAARWLRPPRRIRCGPKARGRSRVEALGTRSSTRDPEGARNPGEHRAHRSPQGARLSDGLDSGSKALKPHAAAASRRPSARTCRSSDTRRRHGQARGEGQEGIGCREAARLRAREKLCRVWNSRSALARNKARQASRGVSRREGAKP